MDSLTDAEEDSVEITWRSAEHKPACRGAGVCEWNALGQDLLSVFRELEGGCEQLALSPGGL